MKKGWCETQNPRCVNRFKLLWTCTLSHSSTTEKVTGMKHKSCWFCPTNPIATPLQVYWFAQSNIALLSQNQSSWYIRAETVAYYTFIYIIKKMYLMHIIYSSVLLHTLNYRYEGTVDCEQDTSTKKLDLIEHKHFCLGKYQEEACMTVWKLWEKHNSSQQLQYYKLNSKACPAEFPISRPACGDSQLSWAFLGHCFGSQWKNICLWVHLKHDL